MSAFRLFRRLRDLLDVDTTGAVDGDALTYDAGADTWVPGAGGGGADDQTAAEVPFTPAGNLAATDVQDALEELDTEKAATTHAHAGEDITSGTVADARIASTIARDSEVTAAISAHEGASDPHPGYTTAAELSSAVSASEAGQVRDGDAAGGVLGGTYPNPAFAADMATQAELDAHVNDTSAAHAASAVSVNSATLVGTGTDVQAVFEELDNAIADHLADTTDAHDASAISVLDTAGDYTGTDVETVLAEIADLIAAGGGGGGGGSGLFDAIALLSDEKASGTDGGTFTSGAWRTRDLNTESDPQGIVSLSSNQFTLEAGTYLIKWRAPAAGANAKINYHKSKLRNITDSTDEAWGSSEYLGSGSGGFLTHASEGVAVVTIAGTKVFEIQHRCSVTSDTGTGFGQSVGAGLGTVTEVYTEVEISRFGTLAADGVSAGLFDAYALLRDEKASGTNGGTFTSGAWQTHDLTVEKADTASMVSLSANQFTLGPGTYVVRGWISGYTVQDFQSRLYNVTDSAVLAVGRSGWAWANAADSKTADSVSPFTGVFTLTATKTIELQARCASTFANIGLGVPTSWGTECYGEVEIFRKASATSDPGGERELDYVEYSGGGITISATTAAGATTLLTGNPVTYDGTQRICIEAYCPNIEAASPGGSYVAILLFDGSTQVGIIGFFGVGDGRTDDNAMLVRRFITPTAGSHTYSIRGYSAVSSGFFGGAAGGNDTLLPAYLRITEPQGVLIETNPTFLDHEISGSASGIDTNTILGGDIPQTGTHIRIRCQLRATNSGAVNVGIRFNNDSGSNYDSEESAVNGASHSASAVAGATSGIVGACAGSGNTTGKTGWFEILVYFYRDVTFMRTYTSFGGRSEDNANEQHIKKVAGTWRNAADAITRIQLVPSAGTTFVVGSRVTMTLE